MVCDNLPAETRNKRQLKDTTMPSNTQPPRMLSAPLRLTAMTLRGLGPYLHGARLEIKPLTILCGENGSGKSTWIEALRFLKMAAEDNKFPLKAHQDDDCFSQHQKIVNEMREILKGAIDASCFERFYELSAKLNAHFEEHADGSRRPRFGINEPFLQPGVGSKGKEEARLKLLGEITETGEENKRFRKANQQKFGPPGSIGLAIKAVKSKRIRNVNSDDIQLPFDVATRPQRLLWRGEMKAGTTLQLRWKIPALTTLDDLQQSIELRLNGGHILRLRRSMKDADERRNSPKPTSRAELMAPAWKHFTLECSNTFLGSEPFNGKKILKLALVDHDGSVVEVAPGSPITDRHRVQRACDNFLTIFRSVVRSITRGVFPIGAVRRILSAESSKSTHLDRGNAPEFDEDIARDLRLEAERDRRRAAARIRPWRRYVGSNGQHTQELHAYWAYNLMRQPTNPFCGEISNRFTSSQFTLISPADLLLNLNEEFQQHLLSLIDPELRETWVDGFKSSQRDQLAIKVLNQVLERRNLFKREFRPGNVTGEASTMIGSDLEQQNRRLSSRLLLSDDEVSRVNRLLLEMIFDEAADTEVRNLRSQNEHERIDYSQFQRRCQHSSGFLFETFVSYWMKRLTKTDVKYLKFEGEPLGNSWEQPNRDIVATVPNGGLIDKMRLWQKRGEYADQTAGRYALDGEDLRETITPPTTRFSTDWSIMSTGFHQLAPIVVQAGLLHQNEIMAVENPEAHLHPKLQIEVAEFLMHQANAGKIMLVETHSDLFVRRILRSIREEQVSPGNVFKQSSVGINFTSLVPDEQNGFEYAKIEELEINEKGQVHNWPPGFMDDDLKEANNWLTALERKRNQDDGE